mgnify:FL=1|tara:strand:+ start:745 stop:2010 length:1266 start_codon:yes stop_codon:yes gene_type:complete
MNATTLLQSRRLKGRTPINPWLCFPAAIQAVYDQEYAGERVRELRSAIFVGLALYNVFNISSFVLLPDQVLTSIILRLGVVTPISLGVAWLIGRTSPRWTERLVTAGVSGAYLVPVFLFWVSRDPNALFTFGEFALTIVFATMLLALRFPHAVLFTAGAAAITALALATKSGVSAPLALAFAVQFATACAFGLYANYRHEKRRCSDFLTALVATLDASDAKAVSKTYRHLSLTDALTGLPNRRLLTDRLELWLAEHRPVAVMMIDIDHFKAYNDSLGHPAGDDCLQLVADAFAQIASETEGAFCARFGGEEFTFGLRDAEDAEVARLARKVRQSVEDLCIPHPDRPDDTHVVTVSIGVAQSEAGAKCSLKDLLTAADQSLYLAKAQGRNRVAIADEFARAAESSSRLVRGVTALKVPFRNR